MKRFFISFLIMLMLLFPVSLYAALGSCTQALSFVSSTGNPVNDFRILEFNCTFGTGADAGTELTSTVTTTNTTILNGMFLLLGVTYNGATAPTALYDVYLRETIGSTADAIDVLGTGGLNRPGTAGVSSQFLPITDTTYVSPGLRPILNTLKLTVSGNLVESGNTKIQFVFIK